MVALLTGIETAGLVDAAELARRLGVGRDYIYRHADEMGVIRVGDGKRARLRFDSDSAMASEDPGPKPSATLSLVLAARVLGDDAGVELLPIRGRRAA